MVITETSFLTLNYRLSNLLGVDFINTFGHSPATLSLGAGQLSPVLESYLIGLNQGAHVCFEISAAESPFGQHNADGVQWVARSLLQTLGEADATYSEGEVVQFPTPNAQSTYAGSVVKVSDHAVCFDFNHPLAGQAVRFEVQVLGVL